MKLKLGIKQKSKPATFVGSSTEPQLGIVCLHLLQACMSYINTLIFQEVLSRPEWQNVLTPEDYRALNLLFHSYINPYGLFPLNLHKRLGIAANDTNYSKETRHENISPHVSETRWKTALA